MLNVELAVEFDPEDCRLALPYLELIVDGVTRRVLLDSGAARSSLTAPPGRRTWDVDSQGTGAFGVAGAPTEQHWQANLALPGGPLGTFEVVDQPTGEGQQLVGQDVLVQYRCHYRLAAKYLILEGPQYPSGTVSAGVPLTHPGTSARPGEPAIHGDPIQPGEPARHEQPMHLGENGHVYLDADWADDQHASAVFDTGASITVIDSSWADAHADLLTSAGSSMGTDASGTTFETPMVELAGPRILGHRFASSIAAVVDLEAANGTNSRRMDLILGWPLLSQAEWIIDHPAALAACKVVRS